MISIPRSCAHSGRSTPPLHLLLHHLYYCCSLHPSSHILLFPACLLHSLSLPLTPSLLLPLLPWLPFFSLPYFFFLTPFPPLSLTRSLSLQFCQTIFCFFFFWPEKADLSPASVLNQASACNRLLAERMCVNRPKQKGLVWCILSSQVGINLDYYYLLFFVSNSDAIESAGCCYQQVITRRVRFNPARSSSI